MNHCTHCDEIAFSPVFNESDSHCEKPFCCLGCLSVFNIINHKGLDQYYEIKKQSAILKRRSPVETKNLEFKYMDSELFLNEYTYQNLSGHRTMEFYLEGIHCLACLWIIEKLPEYLEDVHLCRLDMVKSIVIVSLNKKGLFSNVARELNNLGYKPHPLKKNQNTNELAKKEERKMLLKIGIAGAGAGNIMLYAVSIYAGASGTYAQAFNWLTIFFAIPVLFYSATPFYKNAWNGIKNHTLSIDIPISMALLLGAAFGFYNVSQGITENYFDSLSALVFLLLLSRYFLSKIQELGLSANDLNFFYEGSTVLKKEKDSFIEIHPQYLKVNDLIKISANEMIPADGIVIEGHGLINNSLLTGESQPQKVGIHSQVYSGTINLSEEIIIKVEKTREESRLGEILKQVENGWIHKSPIVDLTNFVSKYFIAAVFVLAIILFTTLFLKGHLPEAFERSLTLLIVTCPCALALATPLTLTRTLARAQKFGIIIKNNEVVEKLSKISEIYLDKTGTLTYGVLKIEHLNQLSETHYPLYDIINSLECFSKHPAAIALREYALKSSRDLARHTVIDYQEIMGQGVEGVIGNHFYEIRKNQIFENKICVAEFSFADQLRDDSKAAIKNLNRLGLSLKMISGDCKKEVLSIANEAGITEENSFFEMSPESKLAFIKNNPQALMVGDGANDAMALSQAYVGVAVMGSLDISLRSADIYLTTPGIGQLENLILISRETMKVIRRNLILSLIYNSFSVYAAFTGMISPLVAAIIMPLSSLTVLASTLIGTKKLNALFKMEENL